MKLPIRSFSIAGLTLVAAGIIAYTWFNHRITQDYERYTGYLEQATGLAFVRTRDNRGIRSAYIETTAYAQVAGQDGSLTKMKILTIEHWIEYGPSLTGTDGASTKGLAGIQSTVKLAADDQSIIPKAVQSAWAINTYTVLDWDHNSQTVIESSPFDIDDEPSATKVQWGGMSGNIVYSIVDNVMRNEIETDKLSLQNDKFTLLVGPSHWVTTAQLDQSGIWIGDSRFSLQTIALTLADTNVPSPLVSFDNFEVKETASLDTGLLRNRSTMDISGLRLGTVQFNSVSSEGLLSNLHIPTLKKLSEAQPADGTVDLSFVSALAAHNPRLDVDHFTAQSFDGNFELKGHLTLAKSESPSQNMPSMLPGADLEGYLLASISRELLLALAENPVRGATLVAQPSADQKGLLVQILAQLVEAGWLIVREDDYILEARFDKETLLVNGKDGMQMIALFMANLVASNGNVQPGAPTSQP